MRRIRTHWHYRCVPKCFNLRQQSVCMRSKTWLAASVWLRLARLPPPASRVRRSRLLAHACVTGVVRLCPMGPKFRYTGYKRLNSHRDTRARLPRTCGECCASHMCRFSVSTDSSVASLGSADEASDALVGLHTRNTVTKTDIIARMDAVMQTFELWNEI